jgi:peptide/nickel transport system permease protein
MLRLLARRLVWGSLTLLVVAATTFVLSKQVPGDQVMRYAGINDEDNFATGANAKLNEAAYLRAATELHADKPVFYLSVLSSALPDTLYRVFPMHKAQRIKALAMQVGDWPAVQNYLNEEQALLKKIGNFQATEDQLIEQNLVKQELSCATTPDQIVSKLLGLNLPAQDIAAALQSAQNLSPQRKSTIVRPRWVWYGADNQFQHWLGSYLTLDFGKSYKDRQSVLTKIGTALPVTMALSGMSLLIAFGFAPKIARWLVAQPQNSRRSRWVHTILYGAYALPTFVMAMILISLFASPDFGMPWFPASGLGLRGSYLSFFEWLGQRTSHLILPLIAMSYHSITYLTLLIKADLLRESSQEYVRTALMKGLSPTQTLRRHIFPNALLPYWTLLGQSLPSLVTGSVLIEVLFNLPGMGTLLIEATSNRDWSVVFGCFWLSAIATILGLIASDLLVFRSSPRVSH